MWTADGASDITWLYIGWHKNKLINTLCLYDAFYPNYKYQPLFCHHRYFFTVHMERNVVKVKAEPVSKA